MKTCNVPSTVTVCVTLYNVMYQVLSTAKVSSLKKIVQVYTNDSSEEGKPPEWRRGGHLNEGGDVFGGSCPEKHALTLIQNSAWFYGVQAGKDSSDSPMDTNFMFSLSKNSRATDTFSSCIWRKVGLWLYFLNIFFWDSTSRSPMSRSPSLRSVCKLPILLLTHFRCSLHHRVKVFCWIFFHGASSARSFSVAGISASLSVERALGAGAVLWWSRGCEPLIFMASTHSWFAGYFLGGVCSTSICRSLFLSLFLSLVCVKEKRKRKNWVNISDSLIARR